MMPDYFKAIIRVLTNLLTVIVLIVFVVLSTIVQIRDAAMDVASVEERRVLKIRLDEADRDRANLRQRIEALERERP